MSKARQVFGKWGEEQAAAYLAERGYQILEQNARTAYGEIDIVTRQQSLLVFVEVKTRHNTRFGNPEEAVGVRKQAHLLEAAAAYIQAYPELGENWRIDVVAILDRPGTDVEILHFENAVS